MSTDHPAATHGSAVTNPRRIRGIPRASVTRLSTRVATLEASGDPNVQIPAKQLLERLQTACTEFKQAHLLLVDTIENEEELDREQAVLDEFLDIVSDLTIRLNALMSADNGPKHCDDHKVMEKRLGRLQKCLTDVTDAVASLTATDTPRLKQRSEQLQDYKHELADINIKLLSLELEDTDPLVTLHARLEEIVFRLSLRIKEIEASTAPPAPMPHAPDVKGVKLPKLEVPTFNGSILDWRSFWEQFTVAVHDNRKLFDTEKLVYLQQALKGGSAKGAIEGLSRSGDNYEEAIQCLKGRYNRPRLIHQAHVKSILDAPPLKDGTGKEIRKLHDTVMQHLRALKSMGYDPPGPFITSTLELKLDQVTMFEWQKHSVKAEDVPHYQDILDFLNLRAQATESTLVDSGTKKSNPKKGYVASHVAHSNTSGQCVVCKDKHPLYACPRFKDMDHDSKLAILKTNRLCLNCFSSNHFVKQCKSVHRCKQCQKQHHTLLHTDSATPPTMNPSAPPFKPQNSTQSPVVSSNTAIQLKSNSLMMTCRLLVCAPDGTCVEARALLDNASSASFVSERLAQNLRLSRTYHHARISGVAGLSHQSSKQSLANFSIMPLKSPQRKIHITAIIVPKVTCDLPFSPVPFKREWNHLNELDLADPGFGCPGKIDLLLGVDVFVDVILHGRRSGLPGTPLAFETCFGWVLAGSAEACSPASQVTTCHIMCTTGDDMLRKFWEVQESPMSETSLSPEEKSAVQHFKVNHSRTEGGRFVVPLPRKENCKPLGESRSQAVRRFLSLERTLHSKNQFGAFRAVMNEYLELGHAESVPQDDLNKAPSKVFYLPMHAVRKDSSTTTKIRAVFDASMKTGTGVSLNDVLMVGPTVHSSLVDVLLRFRMHRIALVADVSKMYRAIQLPLADRDFHRFVWRDRQSDILRDFRMTRVTFGVSSSSFVANMAIKQNAADKAHKYPLAAQVVDDGFYVDDCLTGADSVEEGIELSSQLRALFAEADFLLRKWNSSSTSVLQAIPPELRDDQTSLTISDQEETYTKTLGIEWHSVLDYFRLSVANQSTHTALTKRALVSDVAKTYDVLGWFAPVIIKAKILLQRVWESKVDWDDPVPDPIVEEWSLWRSQLSSLSKVHIPRCYFPKDVELVSTQLHGFSDASASAYSAAVYLRFTDQSGGVHVTLVASKTKVAPIKRLTIPRLELCGAHLLTKLLDHVRITLKLPIESTFAWTDSTIVINWLDGNPRRFKTYVGNRISFILDRIPPHKWKHVPGDQNPADCASRGMFPHELMSHDLWWKGPDWLRSTPACWPRQTNLSTDASEVDELVQTCHLTTIHNPDPLLSVKQFSSYNKVIRVTAWVMRFINNCRVSCTRSASDRLATPLTVQEIATAENYWLSVSQKECFAQEMQTIKSNSALPSGSPLTRLHPFLDSSGILRVTGRGQRSKLAYSSLHPVILSGKHPLTKLII